MNDPGYNDLEKAESAKNRGPVGCKEWQFGDETTKDKPAGSLYG